MEERDFNKVIDRYLTEGKISSEDYENLDERQVYVVQVIKRSVKRLQAKQII